MNGRQFKGLIFDFDGTLAPNLDLPGMRGEVIELTRAAGVPDAVFADRYIVEIIDAATEWLRGQAVDRADAYHRRAHQCVMDIELAAAARTLPFPASLRLLRALRRTGIATAVVTRNCRAAVRTTFPDIDDYLDLVLARDDVPFLKPDVRHVRQALDQLALTPEHTAMVGDGQLDMHTGRALGMTCLGVLTGSSDAAGLREAGADRIFDDMEALHRWLH